MVTDRGLSRASGQRRSNYSLAIAWIVCAAFWGLVRIGDKLASSATVSEGAPQIPSLTEYVNDEMHILSLGEKFALNARLSQLNRETSIQMAIAILPEPPDADLEAFTIDVADDASIGQAGTDDGVILFVFPQQRLARLEVGYGMEGVIPDVLAYRLLSDGLKPEWRDAHYFEALVGSVDAITNLGHEEYTAVNGPGRFERLVRTFGIGSAKVARDAWPLLRNISPWHQVVVSFFAAFIMIGLAHGLRQLFALLRNVLTFVRKASSGRTLRTATTRVDMKSISDSVLVLLPLLAAIFAAAGFVLAAVARRLRAGLHGFGFAHAPHDHDREDRPARCTRAIGLQCGLPR
ncbi:MAG: TPM domain-containing protein [Xanthomonadales bacterium]|nr:TPM domain-containing protein [Xanthomonadales bacterium]